MEHLKLNSVGNTGQETSYVKNTESYGSAWALSRSIKLVALCHNAESAENMPIHWKWQMCSQNNNE